VKRVVGRVVNTLGNSPCETLITGRKSRTEDVRNVCPTVKRVVEREDLSAQHASLLPYSFGTSASMFKNQPTVNREREREERGDGKRFTTNCSLCNCPL